MSGDQSFFNESHKTFLISALQRLELKAIFIHLKCRHSLNSKGLNCILIGVYINSLQCYIRKIRNELLVSCANLSAGLTLSRCEGNEKRLATVSSCSDCRLKVSLVIKVKTTSEIVSLCFFCVRLCYMVVQWIIYNSCNVGADIRVVSYGTLRILFYSHI